MKKTAKNTHDDRQQFFALLKRFGAPGALLPPLAALEDDEDAEAASEATSTAKIVMAEMRETQAEIDADVGAEEERCVVRSVMKIVSVPEFREP